MSCRTLEGRLATILYAIFGIPLMLIVLGKLGDMLFEKLQKIWDFMKRLISF